MISTLLTLFLVGIAVIFAVGIVLSILGVVVSFAFLLLFKVLPVLIVGYLVVRFLVPKRREISAADRDWLES